MIILIMKMFFKQSGEDPHTLHAEIIIIIAYFSANMSSSKNYIFLYINTTMSYNNKCNVASSVASWVLGRPE